MTGPSKPAPPPPPPAPPPPPPVSPEHKVGERLRELHDIRNKTPEEILDEQ